MARSAIVILLLVTLKGLAGAQTPPSHEQRARGYFETGLGQYHLGRFQDAFESFAAGYGLTKRPAFLINMAQSQRSLNHLREARELLVRFMKEAPANDASRKSVQGLIRDLDERIAKLPPEIEPEPSPSRESKKDALVIAPAAASPVASTARAPRPWHRDPLGGVFVGVGAAFIAAGAPLWAIGSQRATAANQATRFDDFSRKLDDASQSLLFQRLGISFVAAGGAALLVGAVRWGVLAQRQRRERTP